MTKKTNRNDACPCGSGKKYKQCCGKDGDHSLSSQSKIVLVGVVAAVIIVGAIAIFAPAGNNSGSADHPVTQSGFTPQPAGPAPSGKVWSTEHGHWHDAPATQPAPSPTQPASTPTQPATATLPSGLQSGQQASVPQPAYTPQPAGPAPAGKVWSPEHGHWHDAATAQAASTPTPPPATVTLPSGLQTGQQANASKPAITPQPDGPVPAGKVWSPEHGHWHDAVATQPSGIVSPPQGESATPQNKTGGN